MVRREGGVAKVELLQKRLAPKLGMRVHRADVSAHQALVAVSK
jgi:hypothetical protein